MRAVLDVLLVEDNEADARLIDEFLEEAGAADSFDLMHVLDLADAEQALRERRFDIVLLDLNLPDARGAETLRRAQAVQPDLAIVILTEINDRALELKAVELGAEDFLPKRLLDADRLTRTLRYAAARGSMKRKLRAIVANHADGIVVVGVDDGLVKFANPRAAQLFATTTSALVGKPLAFQLVVGSCVEIDLEHGTASVRVSELEWDDEAALLASIRDVTDRKRAEELQQRLFHADRLASIGQLAAGVAHEVNNPAQYLLSNLTALEMHIAELGNLVSELRRVDEVADVSARLDAHEVDDILGDAREMLSDNRGGVQRIVDTVRDLGVFARNGEDELELLDINDAIKVACNMTLNEIRHRARLIVERGDVSQTIASRAKLCQVFINLLLNAAHAIEEGAAENNLIRIASRQVGDTIRVVVEDTGCGIPADVRERIFEPFFTTKPRGVGTGLGLSLTADIVRQHRGSIEMAPRDGRGTSFQVTLPIVTSYHAPRQSQIRRKNAPPARGLSLRVLVIDDELSLLKAYERMLRPRHDVTTVRGGAKALEHLASDNAYDVVICDLMMPDVDGKQFYEQLVQTQPELVDRILFCSGGAFTQRSGNFVRSVSNACLEKPFGRSALLEAIYRVAGR